MLANILFAIAAVCLILMVFALLKLIAISWITLLIVAVVCGVVAYFLGGRFVR